MLSMHNVSFCYRRKGTQHIVLDEATFSFEPGKMYAIYGPSGVGKTTCLSLLGGLDRPSGGHIDLDGIDIKQIGYSNLRRNYISYVFQDYHLFSHLTALENVVLSASISKSHVGTEQNDARILLHELGIDEETINRQVSRTSGGQQQRIAIARALITDPTYILADEPTGNLDKVNAERIVELLSDLAHNRGKCVVVATHSDTVCACADVAIEMRGGKLLQGEYNDML